MNKFKPTGGALLAYNAGYEAGELGERKLNPLDYANETQRPWAEWWDTGYDDAEKERERE